MDTEKDGVSRRELADAFGVSRETIREWGVKGWLVRSPSGRFYDLEATRQRHALYVDTRGGTASGARAPAGAGDDAPPPAAALPPDEVQRRKKLADMRQAEADAARAEVALAEERGNLVPVAAVERIWSEIITRAKTEIEALPIRAAPRLVGAHDEASIRTILRSEVERLLRGLSDECPLGR